MFKTMFALFVFGALAIGAAGRAAAADSPIQGLLGNTLTCKGPSWECRYWFNADGTFVSFGLAKAPDGSRTVVGGRGTWSIENDKLCRHPIPAPATPSPCTNWEFGKVPGDKWEHTGGRGTEYFTLLQGRQ